MKKIGLLALAVLSVSPFAFSFSQAATGVPSAKPSLTDSAVSAGALPPARVITLGDSVVALDGMWRFAPGDSPWVSGEPMWAQPGFDDSHWASMDLTPKAGSVDLYSGVAGYLPGWARRGYPDLSGYAWYRLRVKTAGGPMAQDAR
jgi:hypothetical protein